MTHCNVGTLASEKGTPIHTMGPITCCFFDGRSPLRRDFFFPPSSQTSIRSKKTFDLNLSSEMEKIVNNPGLQHLAEKDLKSGMINQSCKQILKKQIFCLEKFKHLSKKNRLDATIIGSRNFQNVSNF